VYLAKAFLSPALALQISLEMALRETSRCYIFFYAHVGAKGDNDDVEIVDVIQAGRGVGGSAKKRVRGGSAGASWGGKRSCV
jgi:hypothetical protein